MEMALLKTPFTVCSSTLIKIGLVFKAIYENLFIDESVEDRRSSECLRNCR